MMTRRRRRKIMGIPVGRSRRSGSAASLARMGAVGAAALAAVPVAERGARLVGKGHGVVERGQDLLGKSQEVADAAAGIKDAVSSHSSTVGKAAGLIGAAVHLGRDGSGGSSGPPKLKHLIEEHTDISVPRSVAYNQWTEMEMFPSIVKGVSAVDQLRHDRTEWISKIGPVRRRWKAEIVEQVPDERIAWRSESGPEHRGVVTFHSLDEDLTRVLVQMHYVPHGPFEVTANSLRVQRRRVRRDLRLFKHFLELRGEETGAWRGRIPTGEGGGEGDDASSAAEAGGHRTGGRRETGAGTSGRATDGNGSRGASTRRSDGSNHRRDTTARNGSRRPRAARPERVRGSAK